MDTHCMATHHTGIIHQRVHVATARVNLVVQFSRLFHAALENLVATTTSIRGAAHLDGAAMVPTQTLEETHIV